MASLMFRVQHSRKKILDFIVFSEAPLGSFIRFSLCPINYHACVAFIGFYYASHSLNLEMEGD